MWASCRTKHTKHHSTFLMNGLAGWQARKIGPAIRRMTLPFRRVRYDATNPINLMQVANKPDLTTSTAPSSSRPFLPVLLLLFAGSGCSALIYEIVWYQLLQLVIGSTAISLGVLLATFMGGLCLGSLLWPRVVSGRQHPLRLYAWIELGIGACGLVALFGMPLIDRIYISAVGHGLPAVLIRALVCAACLMPPTMLMGASLPAAARWIETDAKGASWMGLLYAANTVGAVLGCVLAGFYLLRVYDLATATFAAAGVNLVVAI